MKISRNQKEREQENVGVTSLYSRARKLIICGRTRYCSIKPDGALLRIGMEHDFLPMDNNLISSGCLFCRKALVNYDGVTSRPPFVSIKRPLTIY